MSWRQRLWGLGGVVLGLTSAPAHATPIENFQQVSARGAAAWAAIYGFGGGGLFVSHAGSEPGLLCSSAIAPSLQGQKLRVRETGAGEIWVAGSEGLWRGAADGCGFEAASELDGHFVSALAGDPFEPRRSYLATADGADSENGIYRADDRGAPFVKQGAFAQRFIVSLHVVARGDRQRRFYEAAVASDDMGSHHYTRVSDDEGATWTEHEIATDAFEPKVSYADFTLLAAHPSDPDHLVAVITRGSGLDTLIESTAQGRSGSWTVVAQLGKLGGATFAATGALYFGDEAAASPGLFVAERAGTEPRRLSDTWTVDCLQFDAAQEQLYACHQNLFGRVDLASGELTPQVDMRCAQHWVACPNEPPVSETCAAQLYPENYCNSSHYPAAPLCRVYDRGDEAETAAMVASRLGYRCEQGLGVTVPKSTPVPTPPTVAAAGSDAPKATDTTVTPGGCTVTRVTHLTPESGLFVSSWLLFGVLGSCVRARTRARR